MKRITIALATVVAFSGAAHADASIYVYELTGIETCQIKTEFNYKQSAEQQLGKRMVAGEFTSAQLEKWKKDYAAMAKDKATFCSGFASFLKILDGAAK